MNSLAFAGLPGGSEVFVIIFVIMLLFGAKKLPELSRSLGKSLGEFKKGKEDLEQELRDTEQDLRKVAETPVVEKKKAPSVKKETIANAAEESGDAER